MKHNLILSSKKIYVALLLVLGILFTANLFAANVHNTVTPGLYKDTANPDQILYLPADQIDKVIWKASNSQNLCPIWYKYTVTGNTFDATGVVDTGYHMHGSINNNEIKITQANQLCGSGATPLGTYKLG